MGGASPKESNMLELLGAAVGLLYIWLEYRASIWLWVAGIVMPAIYVFVYFDARLYADAAINVYYILAAFYGIAVWLCGRRAAAEETREELPVRQTPLHLWLRLALISAVLTFGVAWLLGFTDSDVRWLDALTTALSIVAMWMLARKYAEQWLVWILVDAVYVFLYLYKSLYPTAALYALYCIIAVFGYLKWRRMAQNSPPAPSPL